MPLLYELDEARTPPCEGVDVRTCWTCGSCYRIPTAWYPVKIDIGYCTVEGEVVTDVHEPNECDEWAPR